ncbi:hypothetical protein BDZ91DRAFT_312641 [Kalaharituber pfeilii]|nr:hypothetical protein BDZ91DRAFT_312641 [Kalaharituber pfeilii]
MGYSACETLTFPPAVPCGLPAQPGILDQASTSSLALYWDPYNQLSSSHSLSSEVTSHQQCRPGGHLQLPNYETPVPAHHYRYPESQTMNNCSPNQDTNYRLSSSQYRLPKLPSNSPPVHHPSSLSRMRKTSVKGRGSGSTALTAIGPSPGKAIYVATSKQNIMGYMHPTTQEVVHKVKLNSFEL